jgi:hypothetical protein
MAAMTRRTGSPFLDRLRAGELTLMLGIRSGRTTDVVHIAHSTGHHGIMVDLEHSTMSADTAATLCAAADGLGLTIAYVRKAAARARPRGWHLQFYAPGHGRTGPAPLLGDLEDTFVIDHMGYMKESADRPRPTSNAC